MKLIHFSLLAAAACLLPTAVADEPSRSAKPFTISVNSDVTPISHTDYRYPYKAAMSGIEGSCDVEFVINAAGKADAIRVAACSSELFRGAAKKVVSGMRFGSRNTATTGVRARISWTMPPAVAGQRTASLD